MVRFPWVLALASIAGCGARPDQTAAGVDDLYVDDFQSDDPSSCGPSDVPLDHREAREFFRLARPVTSRELHDHYELAPCYVTGPVRYRKRQCTFEIRPGAVGTIVCDRESFSSPVTRAINCSSRVDARSAVRMLAQIRRSAIELSSRTLARSRSCDLFWCKRSAIRVLPGIPGCLYVPGGWLRSRSRMALRMTPSASSR